MKAGQIHSAKAARRERLVRELMLSAGAMVALCSAGQAHAQAAPEAPPADDAAAAPGDAIVVTGYRQSIEKSLEQNREANSLIEVITAEDIGKFPAKNVADALRSEEHTSELPALMSIPYADSSVKKKNN